MRNKVVLNTGETLKYKSMRTKGHMGQTEITNYDVIDKDGNIIGSVEHTDAFQIRGLKNRHHLIQKDIVGNIVVDIQW
ncbi:hypothetical protein [Wohlfahrtiimonas chitiniclastica]|uniref:hypothetical protein n=1 Tax=Wohlfahrtiimonas chitiniclastica TaxID=400946 RepID=UPI001BCDEF53|nr:hypothetical protein [Wohlfahrtiimonas chitiniclastica]MBS7815864.1 hypothetical protein [Wohlfahrtiimonas chitiniclastica]MBS7822141.1 hypothetical protein [Wohlfahrtiimonas chitiniclastica]MBS7829933.1 hypothetical protein [Wohlfahrtiimonas chitiniclastica]MBS7831900.1 hypothetical protein [Wohlfahrtiimonas chitiniclastica]